MKAVILSKPEFLDWPPIGRALAAFHKIPLQDAAHLAKKGWGVFAESIDEAAVPAAVAAIQSQGLDAVAVDPSLLAVPRAPHTIRRLTIESKGITIEAVPDEFRTIPWPLITIVAVSVFKQSVVKTIVTKEGPSAGEKIAKMGILLATGIPLPTRKAKMVETKIENPELYFFLDLFLKGGLRIRFDAQTLDYSFLNERKLAGAHANFRLVVADVIAQASGALVNRAGRIFNENKPIASVGYENANDFEAECRWLSALASLRAG